MSKPTTFKCLNCNEKHRCDHRNRGRQSYCSKPACRKASKAASQRRWLSRPENENYFRGADGCERVRRWRAAHPGYWRKKRPAGEGTLQETCESQVVEVEAVADPVPGVALQEALFAQPALLVGLISVVTGHALQEDIAASARRFLDRGRDILRMRPGGPAPVNHEDQTGAMSRAAAARAVPVQLDRSTTGARAPHPGP